MLSVEYIPLFGRLTALLFKVIRREICCCTSAQIEININLGSTVVISPLNSNKCLSSELETFWGAHQGSCDLFHHPDQTAKWSSIQKVAQFISVQQWLVYFRTCIRVFWSGIFGVVSQAQLLNYIFIYSFLCAYLPLLPQRESLWGKISLNLWKVNFSFKIQCNPYLLKRHGELINWWRAQICVNKVHKIILCIALNV